MIAITDIQSTVRTAIAAYTYFTTETVLSDTGLVDVAAEAALATRGIVVLVSPVHGFQVSDQRARVIIGKALFTVRIAINPEINLTVAQKDPVTAALAAGIAVLRCATDPEDWEFEGAPFELSSFDSGLIVYDVNLTKKTRLTF